MKVNQQETTPAVAASANTLDAGRHVCQEARVVLTSLRGGPPNVARGDLAQDLMDIRGLIKHAVTVQEASSDTNEPSPSPSTSTSTSTSTSPSTSSPSAPTIHTVAPTTSHEELSSGLEAPSSDTTSTHSKADFVMVEPSIPATASVAPSDVGPYARPFLQVVMDPRAAGPLTLVALRALHRLLERGSLEPIHNNKQLRNNHKFTFALEPLTKGVLNCKFEQTDAGADEAVEMAIADLLALLVQLDRRSIQTDTLMDAFNTVFVTRNTFVHSPALCYHFEDVLTTMLKVVMEDLDSLRDQAAMLILEFLVNQLLHTPLVGGDDEASREAQMAHNATRVLCLRLTRTALGCAFCNLGNEELVEASSFTTPSSSSEEEEEQRSLLQIVQDDLCLSLLMTGQAIWAYQENSNIAPGFISLEVLSEICSTLSTLWTSAQLRKHLVPQFEAMFTGFYQRALVLLRKRQNPTDSITFHANLVFDAGIEIILESLVDILCLHDHTLTVAQGNGGSLETLFATYDCNIKRSDVACGLMVELCRCSGSKVDEEGDVLDTPLLGDIPTPHNSMAPPTPAEPMSEQQQQQQQQQPQASKKNQLKTNENSEMLPNPSDGYLRHVPPHLKELCAEAIIGGMKCLFKDDHPSEQTKMERQNRQTIMAGHVTPAPQSFSDFERIKSAHHLRNIKSKKRLMRRAAQLFNKKPSNGIEFLVSSGVISDPVTPRSVASFLRNGIVVGLDKRKVGEYLGEVGKGPQAGKSPPDWERDWFHKEVLNTYCRLFRFERQTLLDGLRMFLAAFRLPGEAQQIDRILQAFSDSCGQMCEESTQAAGKVFSDDPKRASDAAYLLSFSIIMLNTDQHNDNIREDRKMSKEDFVKNNTDYGRDITDKGKELPRDYLGAIYDSIREEEIRTEGEGADGSMTVERWKDVLRGSSEFEGHADDLPSLHDAEDLSELVLEHVWMPIMSAISALWGVRHPSVETATLTRVANPADAGSSGMLGVQGARLGMDMAWNMLVGVRQLGRNDIFRKIFNCVCRYSGLLDYHSDAADRSWTFANSVEAQSAFVVALRIARDATDEIGVEGWKRLWLMLFELRDLKMLGGGVSNRSRSMLMESDPDLLKEDVRRDWTMKLIKRGMVGNLPVKKGGVSSIFGSIGTALFGSVEDPAIDDEDDFGPSRVEVIRTIHGKEDHIIWDELAPSDDEEETNEQADDGFSFHTDSKLTLGARFESQLIQEDLLLNRQREMPVTGLEQFDDTGASSVSPRKRVRKRLAKGCDFAGLVSESRYMDDEGISNLLQALLSLTSVSNRVDDISAQSNADDSTPGEFSTGGQIQQFPMSPASEAFTEVLISELAVRNRDRLTMLWQNHLKSHYFSRLEQVSQTYTETEKELLSVMTGALEKSITGLLRISCCAVQREEIANDVLETWTLLDEVEEGEKKRCLANCLDGHLGEGLWRITRCIDDSTKLGEKGWKGFLSLTHWCAGRGSKLPPIRSKGIGRPVGLAEDDPALQAYRSLHFILNVSEVKDRVPPIAVRCIRNVIVAGECRNCPKLSIAALDLLQVLSNQIESTAISQERSGEVDDEEKSVFWKNNWLPVLESMAEAAQSSSSPVSEHRYPPRFDVTKFSYKVFSLSVGCPPALSVHAHGFVPRQTRWAHSGRSPM